MQFDTNTGWNSRQILMQNSWAGQPIRQEVLQLLEENFCGRIFSLVLYQYQYQQFQEDITNKFQN